MKKFIYYIGFLALCLLPASCSLEEESSTEVEKDKYMNDAKEAQDVLLGVYRSTVEDAMYGYHLSIYFSMGTDISQVEGSTTENFRSLCKSLHKLRKHTLHRHRQPYGSYHERVQHGMCERVAATADTHCRDARILNKLAVSAPPTLKNSKNKGYDSKDDITADRRKTLYRHDGKP